MDILMAALFQILATKYLQKFLYKNKPSDNSFRF